MFAGIVQRAYAERRGASQLLVVFAASIVAACTTDETGASPTDPAATSAQMQLVQPLSSHDGERHLRELAREAPHATAFYFAGPTELVVELQSVADEGEGRAAQRWLEHEALEAGLFPPDVPRPQLQVRRVSGKSTLAELLSWRDAIADRVGAVPSFSSLDLDEQHGKIVVGIEKLEYSGAVREILESAKIPPNVGQIEQSTIVPATYPVPADLLSRSRPLAGGVLIGNRECSLGIAALSETGYPFLMTAGHCSQTLGVLDGIWMRQPQSATAQLGYEFHDYRWFCGSGRCDNADISLYTTDFVDIDSSLGEIPLELGLVWRLTQRLSGPNASGSVSVDAQYPRLAVTGMQSYGIMSQTVDKTGQVTGWTYGSTYKTCADVQFPDNYKFHCQDYASFTARVGDSGGPVFIHYPNFEPSPGGNGISFLGIISAQHLVQGVSKGGTFSNTNQIRSEIGLFRFW